jgi:hypothetical protein
MEWNLDAKSMLNSVTQIIVTTITAVVILRKNSGLDAENKSRKTKGKNKHNQQSQVPPVNNGSKAWMWFERIWSGICIVILGCFLFDTSAPDTGKVSWIVLAGVTLAIVHLRRR